MNTLYYYYHAIIYIIYILWFVIQFFFSVVLMNFVIAVMLNSYKNVKTRAENFKYKLKAKLNLEYMVFYSTWTSNTEPISCFALSANTTDGDASSKWNNFTS